MTPADLPRLRALEKRLAEARGAYDPALEWAIEEALGSIPEHVVKEVGWDYVWWRRPNEWTLWRAKDSEGRSVESWSPPPVLRSTDAAVALCERAAPSWTIAHMSQQDNKTWFVELCEGYLTSYSRVAMAGLGKEGKKELPPTICLALVRALIAQQEDDHA